MMLGTKMNLAAERLVSQRAGGGVDLLTGLSGRKQTLGPGGSVSSTQLASQGPSVVGGVCPAPLQLLS